jgi:hypothetical protein
VPTFVVPFLVIRGTPVLLYPNDITQTQVLPFALASAVPSVSPIVVITEIGVRAKTMNPGVVAALVGAARLAVLLLPTVAGVLLGRPPSPIPLAERASE